MIRKPISSRGFTLIEVLVVISIIAIMIALILPMLSYAKEEAYNAVCTTQLDQIFSATFEYGLDWNNRLPYMAGASTRPYEDQWWPTQIAPGIQNQLEVFLCPNDPSPSKKTFVTYLKDNGERGATLKMASGERSMGKNTITAGAFNLDMSYIGSCDTVDNAKFRKAYGYGQPEGERVARKVTDWARPSKVIMLTEGVAGKQGRDCFRFSDDLAKIFEIFATPNSPSYMKQSWYTAYGRRHGGTTNYLMMDGSVERLRPEEAGEIAKDWQKNLDYF